MKRESGTEPVAVPWRSFSALSFVPAVRWLFFIALSGALLLTDWLLLPVLGVELVWLLLTLLLFNVLA
ncbi:MAG: hypothetical protein R3311_14585, partial [Oceanisphaera sp.]|nr:hypothetical protein [Oceanisphaera sp.]